MKENIELRKCWKCKHEKQLTSEFFYKDSFDSNGFQKTCKDCQKIIREAYKQKHPEYFKNKGKEHYKKENNKERYSKYKDSYLERRSEWSKSVRGKLYDLLEAARTRAVKNNLTIDIDLDFLLKLYEEQGGKCKLTNLNFTFIKREKGKNFNPFNPSIDKIDHLKGYTKDNIRLVCTIVNLALNTFGENNFALMCQAYINHSKNTNI